MEFLWKAGDFNSDGKTDLAVGARNYGEGTYLGSAGRVYIFYNDGSYTSQAAEADVIIDEGQDVSYFGKSMVSGDFNADGRTDLAVGGGFGYGRVYVFYNDGAYPKLSSEADAIIASTGNWYGTPLAAGDLNADGRTDLIVGQAWTSDLCGRAYVYYNDGSYPTSSTDADVTLVGETGGTAYFGQNFAVGDFNSDGKVDLAVSGEGSGTAGRVYVFYQQTTGGYDPVVNAGSAGTIIDGEADPFGEAMNATDINGDGKIDLLVSAHGYAGNRGRIYVFNQGSSGGFGANFNAATADTMITGASGENIGWNIEVGDFNSDGKMDFAFAYQYTNITGKMFIVYNDGSFPADADSTDVILLGEQINDHFGEAAAVGDFNNDGKDDLAVGDYGLATYRGKVFMYTFNDSAATGETSSQFGYSLTAGDFNLDGKTDLAVGANIYNSGAGRVYIFYGDNSLMPSAADADVIIDGETGSQFGDSLASGDFNADGKIDLAVGATLYPTAGTTGRAYLFYNDGSYPTTAAAANLIITGEASSLFGNIMTAADFNADGRTDLAVGANGWSTNTGRVYMFYNDGSIPTTAVTADVKISGVASSQFGSSLTSGDLNADGKTDIAIGAPILTTNTGRVYVFNQSAGGGFCRFS